jgi:hypothetical protein
MIFADEATKHIASLDIVSRNSLKAGPAGGQWPTSEPAGESHYRPTRPPSENQQPDSTPVLGVVGEASTHLGAGTTADQPGPAAQLILAHLIRSAQG